MKEFLLTYLWLQLDENEHSNTRNANNQEASAMPGIATDSLLEKLNAATKKNDLGFKPNAKDAGEEGFLSVRYEV